MAKCMRSRMRKSDKRKLSGDDRDTILRMYNENYTDEEIAIQVGVSRSAVQYTMQAYRAVKNRDADTISRLCKRGVRNAVVWAATTLARTNCISDDILSIIDDEDLTSMKKADSHNKDNELTAILTSINSKLDLIIKELGL